MANPLVILGKNKNISREETGLETVVTMSHFLSLIPLEASWPIWLELKKRKITKAEKFVSLFVKLVVPNSIISIGSQTPGVGRNVADQIASHVGEKRG